MKESDRGSWKWLTITGLMMVPVASSVAEAVPVVHTEAEEKTQGILPTEETKFLRKSSTSDRGR